MTRKKTRKEKKRLILISLVTISLLVCFVCSTAGNFKQILENKKQIISLSSVYKSLLDEEGKLNSEVVKMKDPAYLARYAKEKYLYSEKGDIIIRAD